MWLRLLELQSLILCSGQFYPIHGILISFLMTVLVHVLKNCVIITRFFFVGISTKRVKWCEKDSLPSSVAFMSTRSQSVLKDRLNAWKNNTCEKYTLSHCKEYEKTPSTQSQLPLNRRNGSLREKGTLRWEECWGCPHKSPCCECDLNHGPHQSLGC